MDDTPDTAAVSEDAARTAAVTLIEGWYSGNPDVLDAVIHSTLAKRGLVKHPKTGEMVIANMGKEAFIQSARNGGSELADEDWEIVSATVLDVTDGIATVKVVSTYLVDVCQLADIDGRWQVVNVLWVPRGSPPWWKGKK